MQTLPEKSRSGRSLYLVPSRRVPRCAYVPAGRTLHVVDIENLMGGPRLGAHCLAEAYEAYKVAAGIGPMDQILIAANPALAIAVSHAVPGALLRVRTGNNGADRALLDELAAVDWLAARFDRVIIGSGDGIFTPAIVRIRQCGIAVGVVGLEFHVSRSLLRAATFVRLISRAQTDKEAA